MYKSANQQMGNQFLVYQRAIDGIFELSWLDPDLPIYRRLSA
jgi:hypothetical protein